MPFDIDVLLSQLMENWPTPFDKESWKRNQALSRGVAVMSPGGKPFVRFLESIETGKPRPDLLEPEPQRPQAKLGIAGREADVAEDKLQVIIDAKDRSDRARAEQKRQLGSLVSDMPADKLLNIRRQAADRPEGYTGGEGGFTAAPSSPEIEARLAENKRWLAGQAERDLEYAVTPEQSRRRPEYAEGAAANLSRLRATRTEEQRVSNQAALIASMEKNGKVPYDTAIALQVAGMPVPYESRGLSQQEATDKINGAVVGMQKQIADIMSDPEKRSDPGAARMVKFLEWAMSESSRYIEASGVDPDRAIAEYEALLAKYMQESGALSWVLQQPQQPAVE